MIKVLLVEDNAIDARLTQDILAEWTLETFEITHVSRLSDAFKHLARARFDAVLLDLSLPDGYGLSTVRQMQAANPTIAIIVLVPLVAAGVAAAGGEDRRQRHASSAECACSHEQLATAQGAAWCGERVRASGGHVSLLLSVSRSVVS